MLLACRNERRQAQKELPQRADDERIALMRERMRQWEEKERAADEAAKAGKVVDTAAVTPLAPAPISNPAESERLALIAQRMRERLAKEHQLEDDNCRQKPLGTSQAVPSFIEEL